MWFLISLSKYHRDQIGLDTYTKIVYSHELWCGITTLLVGVFQRSVGGTMSHLTAGTYDDAMTWDFPH